MKDCDDMESFDRKIEKFRSKDLEQEGSGDGVLESFDGKIEKFRSKDSELKESVDGVLESFDGKVEKFRSKDTISRNDSKVDGRSKPRSTKQIEAYKRNFHKGGDIELKLQELDVRMGHLQSLVLRLVRGRWI